METKRNRKTILIALAMIFAMIASSSVAFSPAEAQTVTVQKYPTFNYIDASPNPVGVGQPITIVTWTAEMPPDIGETAGTVASPSGRAGWDGVTLTITDPDGKSETIKLPHSDPVGNNYYVYTPSLTGNYSIQTHFPETWKNSTSSSGAKTCRLYSAADSPIYQFTVQTEQVVMTPGVPLPTEYWTRPIYAYNRDWGMIAGNWMTGLRDLPYISAPNSPHVMWTAPYGFGGISGGNYTGYTDMSYHTGSAYEGKFSDPQIISGWLFYNQALEDSVTTTHTQIIARDLRTGQIYWTMNGTSEAGSSIYNYESPNQHGNHPYLWTSGTFRQALSPGVTPPANTVVDPFTGVELFAYTNVPTGTWAVGPTGERYLITWGGTSSNRTWMALWNSSAIPTMLSGASGTSYWQYRPVGKIHNGTNGYSWNTTLPSGIGTSYQVYVFGDRVISGTGFAQFGTSAYHEKFTVWSVSTKPESRGQLMWKIEPKPPAANVTLQWSSASLQDGVLVLRAKETMQFMGFDINNGNYLWTSEPQSQWMMYSSNSEIYKGVLYSSGYGGEIYAYDVHTGDLLWTQAVDNEGLDSPYQRTPLSQQVVDGKIFVRSQEHSHTQPLYRTWKVWCFNATTGERMYDLNGYWSAFAFSDGYGVSLNSMDNQIYSIGKGPSAISVSTQTDVTSLGNTVLLKGMVTDISAGTKQDDVAPRFPDGVPAVADESMTDWMQYVYMNMPKPSNVTGVKVSLDVIDSNGNFRNIGEATADANGFYILPWIPDISGTYKVIASFQGSDSYWPCSSQTAFIVNEAAPTPTQQPTAAASNTDTYVIGIGVAVIVAIAIVGALIMMMLKKRP